ncbi:MAG: hypothetical protein AB1772_00790 [Candidatus Zixiibacteriota bacterium]
MVIRSYTAESVAAALKQVRSEMGGEAVVLKTRIVDAANGARQYEVTACLDKPTVQQANVVLANEKSGESAKTESPRAARFDISSGPIAPVVESSDIEKRLSAIENLLSLLVQAAKLDPVHLPEEPSPSVRAAEAMQAADVPHSFITEFFKSLRHDLPAQSIDDKTIRRRLIAHLESIIDKKIELKRGDRVLVAGPAGAGKTSIIGRIAAGVIGERHLPVKLISLDSHKVGAMDEIASYGDVLGVKDVAAHAGDKAQSEADGDKVTLIDTAALPRDPKKLAELRQKIQPIHTTYRLAVFSALMRTSDVDTYARELAWLKPTHLVFTMTDLTRRLGSLLSATASTGLKITMITNSANAAGSSDAPDAESIADIILGQEAGRE